MEIDESNFPSYDINELFLISPKELSSELTVGVAITNKNDLEQFFDFEQVIYPSKFQIKYSYLMDI